ncbi:MAG: peptidoglycan DD-metalloendopeptidase family protein, partial [Cyanobacteria bacterium J06636_16]
TSETESEQSQSVTAFVESEEQLDTPSGIQLDSKHSILQEGLETSDVSAAMQPERLTALPALSPVQEANPQADEEQLSSPKEPQVSEATGSPEALVTSPSSTAVLAAESASSQATHQIQAGETVWSIAYAHGIEPEALRQANQISNPNIIFPGDTLVLPGPDLGAASSLGNTETAELVQAASVNDGASLSEEALPSRDEPEAKALVNDGIPVFDVDAIAVENRSVEDVSVVEAPPVEVDTLSLGEPEASLLAAASETLQEEASSPVAIDFDPVAETSALSSASRVLNEGENLASARNVEGLGIGRGVLSDIRESLSSPEQLLAATATSSTVLEADSLDIEGNGVDATDEVVDSSEALLAAAPLGSEVYAPIVESPEGRVVSPDLPALPAQGEYLPEAPDRFEGYMWPAQGVLTSGYGWRWGRMHQGVDIAGPVGTPIFSAASGTVVRSGWNSGGYGNVVDIRHPDGSLTRYAHNSRLLVEEGQEVRQGQQIAEMGSTGYSTGPHLHFEIHLPDQGAVNPSAYLPGR